MSGASQPRSPRLYDDLAWLWPLLSPPEDYAGEAAIISDILHEYGVDQGRPSIIEFGAGGGHTLCHLTERYDTVAVDVSETMLAHCSKRSPRTEAIVGDMRDIRLHRIFDAVLIHDAVDYMTTRDDLRAALVTAAAHLRPRGLLLVAPTYLAESFEDHETAADTRCDDQIELSYVSHVRRTSATTIELTLVIMIRQHGELSVVEDRHTCGLFDMATWRGVLAEAGFEVAREPSLDDLDNEPFGMFVALKR